MKVETLELSFFILGDTNTLHTVLCGLGWGGSYKEMAEKFSIRPTSQWPNIKILILESRSGQ